MPETEPDRTFGLLDFIFSHGLGGFQAADVDARGIIHNAVSTIDETHMPQIIEPKDPQPSAADTQASPEDRLAVQREALKRSLDAIAAEVTAALNDAGLAMTVFLTVPSSGDALMTFASPMDPSDDDWSRASQMVCSIVGGKVGVAGLRARPVPCAAAGSAMGAADVSVREASGFGVPTLEQAAKAVSDRAAGGLSSGSPQTS